jgi:hypothetical protein
LDDLKEFNWAVEKEIFHQIIMQKFFRSFAKNKSTIKLFHKNLISLNNLEIGFLSKLKERNLLFEYTNGIENIFKDEKNFTVYAGFDPTASGLHIGNLVILQTLKHFQKEGYKIVCVGKNLFSKQSWWCHRSCNIFFKNRLEIQVEKVLKDQY